MASEIFVWAYLPGDVEPTLCGRFEGLTTAFVLTGFFVYDTSYLENPSAVAVDPIALPLRAQKFSTTLSNEDLGSLLDATPDYWGRIVIDKLHGPLEFPGKYMLHTCGDAVGNLMFSQSSTEAPVPKRAISAEDIVLARSVLQDLDSRPRLVPPELVEQVRANTAMGGARPKLTIEKDGRLWLAKFPEGQDDPLLPMAKLEAAMLDLARRCGIDSVCAHVVHDDVLLVERFDRGPVDGRGMARRDAFLSARTLFKCMGHWMFTGSYAGLAMGLSHYSCQSARDKVELFRRMVFNTLISNTDDHDRNHGLVADDMPGSYRLSPAYDLVPRRHGTTSRRQAMIVGKELYFATKANLLSDCEAFGLTRHKAEAIYEQVAEQVTANWRECLVGQGVSVDGIAKVEGCFAGIPDAARGRW